MKPYTILLLFLALLFSGEANAKLFKATIIDLEGNAIECQVKAPARLATGEIVEITMTNRVKAILPDGSKLKFRPNELQRVILHDTAKGSRTFESLKMGRRMVLLEVLNEGPVPLYRHYFVPPGSYFPTSSYAVTGTNGEIESLAPFDWRQRLTKLFPDVEYFQRERKEKNFRLNELPELLAGYEETLK